MTPRHHADLPIIQRSLALHAIPYAHMTLVQCHRVLLHHITTGACADYALDASSTPRPDRSACRALSQDFEAVADIAKAALNIILDADHTEISTEALSHVAAALNISVPGDRNLRFKLRVALRKHAENVSSAGAHVRSSTSIADFFNSFESHRRPVLLSIAALHRIHVLEKATIDSLRTQITQHLLSGQCTQFSQCHPSISLPNGLSLPDCEDVHEEWLGNNLDTDLQIHILTAIYGSKISLNTLRWVLNNLNVHHEDKDTIGQLHRKLKGYITDLRKGKKVEQIQEQERVARAKYNEEVEAIRRLWPQLIPQSVKNNCVRKFRDQTSSAALSTFTCASCAESVSLRSHCSVAVGDSKFDLSVLKRPDLKSDEANLLDRYRWLHPDCVPPTMPFDKGPLRDLLLDPDAQPFSPCAELVIQT
ncbi:hypothetical protein B0H13DRAFT_2578761 [Mycena leptocephala]|nr:hypothetical protein B0H13DRAFT_2578761 [Mycena leptocephala]